MSTRDKVFALLWRLFSTVEAVQYSGELISVLWGFSISTVEVDNYGRELTSVK